jgi:hypothetical protein
MPARLNVLFASLIVVCSALATTSHSQAQQAERWAAEGWKTDFTRTTIDLAEIRSGGPPRDGIPPIDEPKFVPVSEAELKPIDPLIALTINGDARAYPLAVMTYHEIVNDTVGGKPVAVTYCPLCNAAITFDAAVNGKALTFGTTGKLRKSDLVMYDRATDSWWQQFSGEAIVGEMVGTSLKMVPSRLESWHRFKAQHPDGKVLVPNNPAMRPYGRNPYVGYDTSRLPFLYDGDLPEGIEPMARVVLARPEAAAPIAISVDRLRRESPVQHGGLIFSWEAGQASALDSASISAGRDVGNIVVSDSAGEDVVHDITFAFVAHAFKPGLEILQ